MTKEASINSKKPTSHKLQPDHHAVNLGLNNKRIVFKNPICLETEKLTTNNTLVREEIVGKIMKYLDRTKRKHHMSEYVGHNFFEGNLQL